MLASTQREHHQTLKRGEMAEEVRVVEVEVGVGEAKKKMMRMKVLVAVDESEGSLYALRWALDHLCGGAAGADTDRSPAVVLLLLHVQQPFQHYILPAGPGIYATSSVVDSIRKGQVENTNRLLSRAMEICAEKRVTAETLVVDGDPKDMICQAAEQMQTDLVVVGSRGLSTIKRAFLGSVSDYVAHHAPCPVLIVKPQKQTQ